MVLPDDERTICLTSGPARSGPRALLCYLVESFDPLLDPSQLRSHSNLWQCRRMAEVLQERGYAVDVTQWRNPIPPDPTAYDLVLGVGRSFELAARARRPDAKALYYGTGTYYAQTNRAVLRRCREVRRRTGAPIEAPLLPRDEGIRHADAALVVGTSWTIETYGRRGAGPRLESRNTIVDDVIPRDEASPPADPTRFVWMAAYGALRRRLDLVLEVFERRPDLSLTVCGNVRADKAFFHYFGERLEATPNVDVRGWMDVGSPEFREVVATHGWLLYPSVSDGQPGSVINAMAAGLVPLVTREAGIDVEPFGVVADMRSPERIEAVVDAAAAVSPTELQDRSVAASRATFSTYTRDAFDASLEQGLVALGLPSHRGAIGS